MSPRLYRALPASLFLLASLGCSSPPPPLTGTFRAVLTSPGGELPFGLELEETPEGLSAVVVNGEERATIPTVIRAGDQLTFGFDGYDSKIEATLSRDGRRLSGRWTKTVAGGVSTLPFLAQRGAAPRFVPAAAAAAAVTDGGALPEVAGTWAAQFSDESGPQPAQAEFVARGTHVAGTFLTPTGDYRFLEGSYESGLLRLSTFDGAHAFLFVARARADGTLAGDFWSRDSYHATWTARRAQAGEAVLPDAWSQVGLTSADGRLHFRFPDLTGRTVTADDPRFAGKVVIVNIFGSWCPNCNDEAPLLARWAAEDRGRGLEVVGLAYEVTGDAARDRTMVERFAARHGIDYPLLLAGTSDKAEASATLPDLSAVLAFPTSVFIGRDGKVRKIYSGFAGPGTGKHHEALVAEIRALIETLLAEPAPEGTT